jgi:hypothetical protein
MSLKRTMQAQYDFLVLPAQQSGLASLETWERQALAILYVKEVRKRSFVFEGPDDEAHVAAFLNHARKEFSESEEMKVVLDFQPRLLASAKDLSTRPRPIESIILYATWSEHWLNATLISAALARGLSEEDVTAMVRVGHNVKLGWLWHLLHLPDLPEDAKKKLLLLAEIRNEHVHYKWKGLDPDLLETTPERLRLAAADATRLAEDLVSWEVDVLLHDHIETANRLFDVTLAPEWRALALTRPISAGDPPATEPP